ncbi:AI-2E family transporter [Cryobacterium sp. CG_9.6]|uniref:AI-2E family transporter n=1 Tax=Cryobacterium sp. CG_9.6 TaxID=2760710 RepID=UPI002475DF2D|nr:AI-2E family transporter [Cryobacterium sp. CG_9.6]MDH6237542.1 putative PurR-regulated permease PerM [Cryobacterium sp. CG_9.6]
MTAAIPDDLSPALRRFPRGTIILVSLAAATVTAVGISGIRGILAPVLFTLVLAICAHPVRTMLEARGVPHGLATGSVILVVFLLLAGFTYTVIIAFAQFASMLPQFSTQLADIGANIADALSKLGIDQAQIQALTASFTPGSILSFFSGVLGSVAGITGSLVIVLTMLILMSADGLYVPTILRQLEPRVPNVVSALSNFARQVRRYMVVTTVLGIAQGVLNTIALLILQVPAALLWGLLAFLCSFIPNIGYFFAIIPPVVFGFLVGGWPTAIAVIVVYSVINAVVQSVVQPRVVGNTVALSQTLTFFSVLFWAVIIGPIGAIIAIPLTLLARAILIDADPDTWWWRPALGDTSVTRQLLKANDAITKQTRVDKRASQRPAARNTPDD